MEEKQKNIEELYKLKYSYQKKIESIQEKIDEIQNQIYKDCELKNNGHKWISEKEIGPYGVTFHYCELCNFER